MSGVSGQTSPERLTRRELEILRLVADGRSNQDIAERLFVTVGTVKWYLRQIYGKLHVGSRTQAIAAARAAGVMDGGLAHAEPLAEPFTPPHDLPEQVTPFVGRETELAEIARLLGDPAVRLVTILGPGGIGKTRLSVEAGAAQRSQFRDGVFVVPLAPLSDPALIPSTIADALHISPAPGRPLTDQLLAHLRDKRTLLVLDNMEHLRAGVDLLPDLLRAAPDIKILATSRERLQLQAEVVFRLDGLSFGEWTTPDQAVESGAGKLFVQAARRARLSFTLTQDMLSDLATICRLVNGMPLGILLAAAWADTLSVAEIAQEVRHGFEFLEGDLRDLPVRQRSLRAVFEQSWRLMNPGGALRDVLPVGLPGRVHARGSGTGGRCLAQDTGRPGEQVAAESRLVRALRGARTAAPVRGAGARPNPAGARTGPGAARRLLRRFHGQAMGVVALREDESDCRRN
jgi:DNA-binding CsgD family transcriptional regulator